MAQAVYALSGPPHPSFKAERRRTVSQAHRDLEAARASVDRTHQALTRLLYFLRDRHAAGQVSWTSILALERFRHALAGAVGHFHARADRLLQASRWRPFHGR
jgi:hypothetical protein